MEDQKGAETPVSPEATPLGILSPNSASKGGPPRITTLLKSTAHLFLPALVATYAIGLALLGFLSHHYGVSTSCSSSSGSISSSISSSSSSSVRSINVSSNVGSSSDDVCVLVGFVAHHDYSPWVHNVEFVVVGAFSISLLLQGIRVFVSSFLATDGMGVLEGYYAVMCVNAIALVSNVTTLFFHFGGGSQDMMGVLVPSGTWPEWFSSVPIIVYICLSIDVKGSMTTSDKSILASTFGMILTGGLLATTQSFVLYCIYMAASCLCLLSMYWLFYKSYKNLNLMIETSTWLQQNTSDYSLRLLLAKRKRTLTFILCLLFPLFPVSYFLALFQLIDKDMTYVCIMLSSTITKILFASLFCDAHQEVSHPAFMQLELERASNLSRRAYLRYVFHEVRVPLNSLSLGAHLLNESKNIVADQEIVSMMCEAATTMGETLNDVLALQKIEEGAVELLKVPTFVEEMLYSVLEDYENFASTRNVTMMLEVNVDSKKKYVFDKFRLRHVICSLVSNAIKFSHRGGQTLVKSWIEPITASAPLVPTSNASSTSTTTPAPNKVCLVISVVDHGKGIQYKKVEKIFTPYLVTRPGELQHGRSTGIGLAICKEIVHLHGGVIKCSSEGVGKGTTFVLRIPVEEVAVDAMTLAHKQRLLAMSAGVNVGSSSQHSGLISKSRSFVGINAVGSTISIGGGGGEVASGNAQSEGNMPQVAKATLAAASMESRMRETPPPLNVMVVDDVSSNRKMLQHLLKSRNIASDMAEDGRIAYDAIKAKKLDHYDLIFMDNTMPNMTGIACTKALRALGFDKMIIGVTGNSMEEELAEFRKCGADLVITKPLKIVTLDALIAHINANGAKSSPNHSLFYDGEKQMIIPQPIPRGITAKSR